MGGKSFELDSKPVLILAGIFDLVLVFILRWKCLIVLVTF